MVRLSALPSNLPPTAHLHLANFKLPYTLDAIGVFKLVQELTGLDRPYIKKEFGGRYNYGTFYTLRNEYNAVLITIYSDGTGKFRNTSTVAISGLSFESWNSHNPLSIDPVELIKFVFGQKGYFTRIDNALNDYRRQIDFEELVYISHKDRFRDRLIVKLNRNLPPYYCRQDAEGIYFGSNKSKTQIYIYVKQDKELTKFPWIRAEVKIRGKIQANHVARMILDGMPLDALTAGVLGHYLDCKEAGTLQKHKRPTLRWWTQFVGTEKISLTPKTAKKSKDDTDDFDLIEF